MIIKTSRFILFALVLSVTIGTLVPQPVDARDMADDPGLQGQHLSNVAGQACGNNTNCRKEFITTANQCANMSGNNSGEGVARCIVDRIGSKYDLNDKVGQIAQGVERAFEIQSSSANQSENVGRCKSSVLGFPAWYNGLVCDDYGPTITKLNHIWIIVLNAIRWLLGAAAYGAAVFIIWGGFKYMKSQGDPSAIASAKTTIFQAVGGLGIALISNLLVAWVAGLF